jgi:uncharacterized membrane protein
MSHHRLARSIFLLLSAALATQGLLSYAQLPQTIASHFNAAGAANGYMSKEAFFIMIYGILLGISAAMAYAVPALIASRPEITNLPNKAYWLAPERRAGTLDFLTAHFTWLGSAILALGNAVLYLVVRFHLEHQATLPSDAMWTALMIFFCFVILWMVIFFWRMSAPA